MAKFTAPPFYRGNSWQCAWEILDSSEPPEPIPIGLDGVHILFLEHTDAAAALYSEYVYLHFDGDNGRGSHTLPPEITATFPAGYVYLEITWLPSDGRVITLFSGDVEVIEPGRKYEGDFGAPLPPPSGESPDIGGGDPPPVVEDPVALPPVSAPLVIYPLTSNLVDSTATYTGTFTRYDTKEYVHDDGTLRIIPTDTPAYTGSGVLIEPVIASQQPLSNEVSPISPRWSFYNCSATHNVALGPDGVTMNAGRITQTAGSNFEVTGYSPCTVSSIGQRVCMSMFVHKGNSLSNAIMFGFFGYTATPGPSAYYVFDVITGAITLVGSVRVSDLYARMIPLAGGWYHLYIEGKSTVASGTYTLDLRNYTDGINAPAIGDYWHFYNIQHSRSPLYPSVSVGASGSLVNASTLSIPTTGLSQTSFSIYCELKFEAPLSAGTSYDDYTLLLDEYLSASSYLRLYARADSLKAVHMHAGVAYELVLIAPLPPGAWYKVLLAIDTTTGAMSLRADNLVATAATGTGVVAHSALKPLTIKSTNYLSAFTIRNLRLYNSSAP